MTKIILKLISLIVISAVFFTGKTYAFQLPEASITVRVQDEEGKPIEGSRVGIGFFVGGTKKENAIVGFTDANGCFSGKSESVDVVGFNASKDGYYRSDAEFHYAKSENGKWLPWNPEAVVALRKIGHPVPMYARDTHKSDLKIPDVGVAIGFDLIEYDWVPPYGGGKNADFIIRLDNKYVSDRDYETKVTINFSNKFDGIQAVKNMAGGSIFKLSRYAPTAGYQSRLIRTIKRVPKKAIESNYQEDNNFMFRIRSEEKEGKLVRAMYGKIQGDIKVYPTGPKTAKILFKYFLNPDYTRNLEYDPMQNLFLNLRDSRKLDWVGLE